MNKDKNQPTRIPIAIIKGLFGMNWSKRSKMNLLKLIKFGFITRICLHQDNFEDYADLVGGRFNQDMEQFFEFIHPGFTHAICDGLTDYLETYPHNGYYFPRIEYYPLEQHWKAEVRIQDCEVSLRPALLAARIEKDIGYSNDYMVQIDYAFNATQEDWEKTCKELPDDLLDPIPFGS